MQKLVILSILLTLLFFSCRKEHESDNCQRLTDGMMANDISRVNKAITNFIATLSSSRYTEANVNTLCQRLSSSCNVTARLICFNCILTFPGQTEINITFTSSGAAITKTVDLSYTTSNKIIFRNMHY